MLNNVNTNDVLLNNQLTQQLKLAGVNGNSSAQNPYAKVSEFADVIDISEQAKKLYEKEQEIEKYKELVMQSLNSSDNAEQTANLLDVFKKNDYITDDDIANKILKESKETKNNQLLQMLFSNDDDESIESQLSNLMGL